MSDLTWHDHKITRTHRANQKSQHPCPLWFRGLSEFPYQAPNHPLVESLVEFLQHHERVR